MASIIGFIALGAVAYGLWNLAGILWIIYQTREEKSPVK